MKHKIARLDIETEEDKVFSEFMGYLDSGWKIINTTVVNRTVVYILQKENGEKGTWGTSTVDINAKNVFQGIIKHIEVNQRIRKRKQNVPKNTEQNQAFQNTYQNIIKNT